MVELVRYDSGAALLSTAGPYLEDREAEHNLLLGILGTLRDHPEAYRHSPYLATLAQDEALLVAVRTPPFYLVLSETTIPEADWAEALAQLVEDLIAVDPDPPGVLGPPSLASAFASRWSGAAGRRARLTMSERIYRLSEVRPPPRVPGAWRRAEGRDRALLGAWARAFQAEALPTDAPHPEFDATVEGWISASGRGAYLWDVEGQPVSLVVTGSATPHGIRIGPVYTPPVARRRGYAAALTAAVSDAQLKAGRRFCFLYTDLSNPTSNRIYQAIGYEAVTDAAQYQFDRQPA